MKPITSTHILVHKKIETKIIHKHDIMQNNMYCLPTTGIIYGTYNSPEERMKNIQYPADLSCYFQVSGVHMCNVSN
jgi:hypothetical protein